MFGRKFITFVLVLLSLIVSTTQASKSVFIISKHSTPSQAQAYSIDGNDVTLQGMIDISTYNPGYGAVGNAVWPEKELMFVTYEDSPMIVWASTKTLQKVGEFDTDVTNLSGIAIDENKEKIYIVRRDNDDLYVFSFDEPNNTLVLDNNYELDVPSGYLFAWGIALDETNGLLYISTNTKTVHVYDTNDWSHDHYIDIEAGGTERSAVGIAVDPNRGYLYTGHWTSHNYLVRTNTTSPYTSTEKLVGQEVIGLDVDEETGLVYCTTYHNDFRVYDSNLSLQDTEPNDIYGPAGVAVGGLYKPPFPLVEFVKDANGVNCVSPLISEAEHELLGTPYNWLYYNIDCNANGHADTNVYITDHLPAEVNYIASDPNGFYDPCEHTVTWYIPVMSTSDSNTYRIQCAANYYAKPGHKITNLCEIESDLYYMFTTLETNVCCYGVDIIYVDADANDPNSYHNGTSWLDAYIDLQEALHTARVCGREQIWVAQQTYKPTDINDISARSISFELVDNVALYGGFPPGGGTWTQRNPNVYVTILSGDIAEPDYHSDNSYHVVKCVDVNNAVLDGFTITAGKANGLDSNESGGGIYCKDSYGIMVRNCSISDNSAYYGGGMYNEFSSANITNCIFFDNEATYYNGGAIYNTNSSEPNITNCTFSDNSASEGGAVYNYYNSGPNISNCVFNGNSAIDYGGGMVNSYQSSPIIINCIFSGNSATTVGNSYGGAICNWNNSDPNINNCTFSGNSAQEGGAVYNYYYSDPNIANCIFIANYANMGGGLYSCSSSPNINNCIFAGNSADSYGGGMHNYYYSSVTMANCIFNGNRADYYGGGIANYDNSQLLLTNCTLSGNWAHYGGGIFNWNYADANLTNCIFWDNIAGTNGNEIYNDDETSDVNVTFCDINEVWIGTGNIVEDPCFFSVEQPYGTWTENATYDNSTFQSTLTDSDANWPVNQLAGKFVSPNTPQILQFFIVSNDVNTMKVWSDVNDIAKATKAYKIYDYHLRVDSPCIDAGDPNFNSDPNMTDIDGEPRVFDGDDNEIPIVDMGADEYYWSPADINSDGFVNFFDYAFFASAWQSVPNDPNYNEDCDLEDNDSIDYNDIALFCKDWLWQTAWAKAFPCAYDEGLGRSMSMGMGESLALAEGLYSSQPELTAADIEEIIKWLEDLWLTNEDVREMITEEEWLEFIESVKKAAKEQPYN